MAAANATRMPKITNIKRANTDGNSNFNWFHMTFPSPTPHWLLLQLELPHSSTSGTATGLVSLFMQMLVQTL